MEVQGNVLDKEIDKKAAANDLDKQKADDNQIEAEDQNPED